MRDSGARFIEVAELYLMRFPIGSDAYPTRDFDRWGFGIPSQYKLPKYQKRMSLGDAEWGTHLQNRHRLKDRINRAGRCEVLDPQDRFQIIINKLDSWQTAPLVQAAVDRSRSLASRVQTNLDSRTKITRLLLKKAVDLGILTSQTRSLLEGCDREVDYALEPIVANIRTLERRINDALSNARADILRDKQRGKDVSELEFILGYQDPPQLTDGTKKRSKH